MVQDTVQKKTQLFVGRGPINIQRRKRTSFSLSISFFLSFFSFSILEREGQSNFDGDLTTLPSGRNFIYWGNSVIAQHFFLLLVHVYIILILILFSRQLKLKMKQFFYVEYQVKGKHS